MKKIAVLAPVSTLDHQPGILNAITCFLDAGYEVEVFSVKNKRYAAPDLGNARVRYLPVEFDSEQDPRTVVTILYTLWLLVALRGTYRAVFAGGIRALIAAWINTWFRRNRIINLQLELYIGPKLDVSFGRIFKWVERRAIRASWLSLIHDERRAEMLAEDAGIEADRIAILPNSPLGPSTIKSGSYLQGRLEIPEQTKLLLAPGTIGRNFMSREIVAAAQDLPGDWLCVLHSARSRERSEPYIQELDEENEHGRALLSLQPVPYRDIDEVLASARIGLALYGEVGGANTTEVGLASGKLCQFLKLGIPVIVSDFPVLRKFVEQYGVGVVLSDMSSLPSAVLTIDKDYDAFRHRAAQAFDDVLAFEKHFGNVLDLLDKAGD